MRIMTDTLKPVVSLEHRSSPKKPGNTVNRAATEHSIKLAVRLNEGINEALRSLLRYRGDLSTMALEALRTTDLSDVPLVSSHERMVRDTTITMPRSLHAELRKLANSRDSSMNILVNTALAHWLAKKGVLRLR